MKHFVPTLLATALLSSLVSAQPAPPAGPGPEGDRPPPPQRHDSDRPGDRREGPPGREGRDGPMGSPRAMPGVRPGPLEQMKNFLDVIDRYNQLGKDADASAVAAVINTIDILRPRGSEAIITKLEKMLAESKSVTVQRVIRLQLADFYRQSNQADKAIEHLDALVQGAPGN